MQTPATIYEHPLNERMRFFLRLEFLFRQARHSLRGEAVWDSHNTLTTLLEILNIISRIDIKTEVLKELDRVSGTLNALTDTPDINHETLEQLLATIAGFKSQLHSIEGPLAQELRENELFKLVIQRSSIPGGLCDFDLPQYRHWLKSSPDTRVNNLKYWLSTLDALRLSVELMLKLIRESADPVQQTAENGNYQQTLESSSPFQMIRVWLPTQSPYFVEVSAGRHRLTARFMETSTSDRPKQTTDNVDFHVSCCAL
jgi:cell division protein ZapD